MRTSTQGNMRKNKVDRDEGRDVSEKIALGMLKGTAKLTGESMYDSRLFNQSSGTLCVMSVCVAIRSIMGKV